MPVGLEVLLGNAELRESDLGDALELGLLCDFDVGGHLRVLLLRDSITSILWARHYKGCAIARTLTEIKIQAARTRGRRRWNDEVFRNAPSATTLCACRCSKGRPKQKAPVARGFFSPDRDQEAFSASSVPPPKLECTGTGPPLVTFTAQYLNSGILPTGSSTGLVSMFAAAS